AACSSAPELSVTGTRDEAHATGHQFTCPLPTAITRSPPQRPDSNGTTVAPPALQILDVSHGERRIAAIHHALRVLVQPGQVEELRALGVSTLNYQRLHTESGFFDADHLDLLAREGYQLTHDA